LPDSSQASGISTKIGHFPKPLGNAGSHRGRDKGLMDAAWDDQSLG
jgi:hypothetical protein